MDHAEVLAARFMQPHEAIKRLEKQTGRSVRVQLMMELEIRAALDEAYAEGRRDGEAYASL